MPLGVCSGSVCTRDPRLAVPPGGPAQPQHRGLAARAGADPGVRALHHRRHRAGLLGDGAPAAAARVAPGAVLDIAVWAVPAGIIGARIYHVITSPEKYFGAGGDPIEGVRHLGGRSRHLGRGRRWRARRLDRGPAARHPARRGRRRAGPRAAAGPGDRPVRQLVQQRAVRRPDRPCRGAWRSTGWTRTTPGTRCATTPAQPILEPGLYQPTFLYEALWNLGVVAAGLPARPAVQAGPGPGVRALRDGVHRRPVLDRGDAHRRGQPDPRRAAQRLDRRPGLPRRADLLRAGARPPGVPDPARRGGDATPPRTSDLSQVDLSERETPARAAAPEGYRVVSEEQYAAWQDTGVVPPSGPRRLRPDGGRAAGATSSPPTADAEPDDEPADDPAGRPGRRADAGPARGPPTGTAERGGTDANRGGGRRRGRWPRGGRRAGPLRLAGHPAGARRTGPPRADRRGALAQRRPRAAARSASARAWAPSPPRCPTAGSVARTGTGWCRPGPSRPTGCRWWCTADDLHDTLIAGLGERVEHPDRGRRCATSGSSPASGRRSATAGTPSRPTWWSPPTARTAASAAGSPPRPGRSAPGTPPGGPSSPGTGPRGCPTTSRSAARCSARATGSWPRRWASAAPPAGPPGAASTGWPPPPARPARSRRQTQLALLRRWFAGWHAPIGDAARRHRARPTWSSRRCGSCGRCPARTASRSAPAAWCCSATRRTPCRRTSARAPAWRSRTRPRSASLLRRGSAARTPFRRTTGCAAPGRATVVRQTRRMSAVLQARGRLALRARDAALGTITRRLLSSAAPPPPSRRPPT